MSMGYYTQKREKKTFFSSTHGMCFRIDHILGHKTSLSQFKRREVISSIFSEHSGMKLEINYRKKNNIKIGKQHATKNTVGQ